MLQVTTNELRVRQRRDSMGHLINSWEVVNVVLYSDGTIQRHLICQRDSYAQCMEIIKRKTYF